MVIKSIFTIAFIFIISSLNAQNLCDCVGQNDFDAVERLIEKRVKALRKDKSFSSNSERLDSLKFEMTSLPCVKQAYWDKNTAFVLITKRFIHRLGIQFHTDKGVVEKCYQIQTYYSDYTKPKGFRRKNKELIYLSHSDCEGFIKRHLAVDSSNEASTKKQRHNSICRIEASIVKPERDRKYPIRIYAHEEGLPIKVKLTIQNFSDSVQRFIWPISQNTGRKIIYFEVLNPDGSRHLLESRAVYLPNNETIPYDILTLNPMEKRTFVHTVNGFRQDGQTAIEAHHYIGPLLEGDYKLRAWYDPNPFEENGLKTWQPIEMDSLPFRYTPKLEVIRSRKYQWEQQKFRYQDSITLTDMSQACFRIRVIGGAGNYFYDIGQSSFDAIGIVEEVVKGYQAVGDTIAFSFRYQPRNEAEQAQQKLIKQTIYNHANQEFWVHATNSFANYCRIINAASDQSFLNGKVNYQLIDHLHAIQKHLPTKPKTN